ncbi:MAG: DUF1842 domain-containing protein [Cyanobacteria bacterium P01_E01_bin.42]
MKKILAALAAILVAVCFNLSSAMAADSAFLGCYVIGDTDLVGAPIFKADFVFSTPDEVSGEGEISQPVNPPVDFETYLEGSYSAPLFEGEPYFIISANGYNMAPCPECGGVGPVRLENVKNLEINTLSGNASYQYSEKAGGDFTSVGPVPVKSVSCS